MITGTTGLQSGFPGFGQVKSLRLMTGTYDLQLLVTGKNMQDVSRFVSGDVAHFYRDPGNRDAYHHEVLQRERQYTV